MIISVINIAVESLFAWLKFCSLYTIVQGPLWLGVVVRLGSHIDFIIVDISFDLFLNFEISQICFFVFFGLLVPSSWNSVHSSC